MVLTQADLEEINDLMSLFSVKRATDPNTRLEVGKCLHNISTELLNRWIVFCKKDTQYDVGDCDDIWDEIDDHTNSPGFPSLHLWAQHDNHVKYIRFRSEQIAKKIKSANCQTETYDEHENEPIIIADIGKIIYGAYKYKYKYTQLEDDIWYEFKNHKWIKTNHQALKNTVITEVFNEYLKFAISYDTSSQGAKYFMEIAMMFRDDEMLDQIVDECRKWFYDPYFESLLNTNHDLVCYENGVYDNETNLFRDGRPEDYISVSNGQNFHEPKSADESKLADESQIEPKSADESKLSNKSQLADESKLPNKSQLADESKLVTEPHIEANLINNVK
jgi:hypothetical protein